MVSNFNLFFKFLIFGKFFIDFIEEDKCGCLIWEDGFFVGFMIIIWLCNMFCKFMICIYSFFRYVVIFCFFNGLKMVRILTFWSDGFKKIFVRKVWFFLFFFLMNVCVVLMMYWLRFLVFKYVWNWYKSECCCVEIVINYFNNFKVVN